ncbi:hypothetical protein HW115_19480 [Verrucomicrobiaceae bacterium N1E253]|uniref:Uncharacterized protein n=1 Tax=Oceaniferula marina TaxID=2748318 RepID=A0A851GSQ2_9BACT|nr:hypothetical protein [Oceaniferula marina]NWK57810.1 hypothetical protein [Oceaniferula marina]
MKISVLVEFLNGICDANSLAKDLEGGVVQTSHDGVSYYVDEDYTEDFFVTTEHLVKICDSFTDKLIDAEMVQQITFAMMCSDYLEWDSDTPDGERVAEVIGMWDTPEISYQITNSTIPKFRRYLSSGEDIFNRDDLTPDSYFKRR